MTPTTPLTRTWRTSSYSDSARQCVEIAQAGTECLIRDTKNRTAGQLAFSPAAWAAFTQGIRDGIAAPADR